MATTDARPGFRLPWSSDRTETGDPADAPTPDQVAEASSDERESETTTMTDAAPAGTQTAGDVAPAAHQPVEPPSPPRKTSKFLADLTKAMQAAAESARADTMDKFSADAKAHIEAIHADTANEAVELRKQADDDIAGIREWSKGEIARIREETDHRINERKAGLEREIEDHGGAIEMRVERVQARVTAFETEMTAFFDRLMREEDPTRFAAMAESLPEPPPFDIDRPAWSVAAVVDAPAGPTETSEAPAVDTPASEAHAETAYGETAPVEATADAPAADEPTAEVAARGETDVESTSQPESEPEAVADDQSTAETQTDLPAEPASADTGDLFSIANDGPAEAVDPRLVAIGMDAGFAAAEAEAAAFDPAQPEGASDTQPSDDEIPTIADDALAARLAGLVPDGEPAPSETSSTRVVVLGLVSVASIAGFKRSLSRAAGVHSVGVSSGPDGEFVFAVNHGPDAALKDVIPTLSGFSARITGEDDGSLTVTAKDPEAEG
jgi:hypothetical protein